MLEHAASHSRSVTKLFLFPPQPPNVNCLHEFEAGSKCHRGKLEVVHEPEFKAHEIIRITRSGSDIIDSEKASGSALANFEMRPSLKSTLLKKSFDSIQKQVITDQTDESLWLKNVSKLPLTSHRTPPIFVHYLYLFTK